MSLFKNLSDHVKYGIVVFLAVFFVGWSTGIGGTLIPNIGFSIIMGLLAAVLFRWIKSRSQPDGEGLGGQ